MYAPQFRLRSFDGLALEAREVVLRLMLEALIAANAAHLRAHPETPWLYESGVAYEAEDDDEDEWTDIAETMRRKVGDCEDLAAWRIAELRVRCGEAALPRIEVHKTGPRFLYHVSVRRADGEHEDPSRVLGLR